MSKEIIIKLTKQRPKRYVLRFCDLTIEPCRQKFNKKFEWRTEKGQKTFLKNTIFGLMA